MNKVRYLTISRVSLELVEKLSDQDNAQFNRIIFSCFQQLENGQDLTYQETESPILNVALREAAAELETGYRNYIQKINARKKPSPESESAIDQRSISDQPPTDNRREEKRREKKKEEEMYQEEDTKMKKAYEARVKDLMKQGVDKETAKVMAKVELEYGIIKPVVR